MKCPMCAYPFMNRPKGMMSLPLFKKIVDDAAINSHEIKWLNLFGEPLLWPYLVDGFAYLTSKGLNAKISTNGMLLTPDLAARLSKAGLREALVAIDTLRPDAYARLRIGGNLETIKKNIHEVLAAVPNLIISAQFMPSKYNVGESGAAFLQEFGNRPNFRIENWFVVRMSPLAENVSRTLSHGPNQVDKRKCNKLYEGVCVLWDGRTSLCCLDYDGDMITGDLNKNSIESSYMGPAAEEFRRRIVRGEWGNLPACARCLADHII